MPATIIYERQPCDVPSALTDGDDLWLSTEELHASTGWEHKPQGMCLGDRCVPIPPALQRKFVDPSGRVNLAAFARYLGQPIVHDDGTAIWLFGEAPAARKNALRSLEAPDFSLPDIDGKLHSLGEFRGKKVLLFAWASW